MRAIGTTGRPGRSSAGTCRTDHGSSLPITSWDESVTLIGVRLRRARAVRFARLLLASRVVHVIRTDEAMEEAALNVYERLDDARLSFTDCVSFAVMRALEIPVAFAFDRDFGAPGSASCEGAELWRTEKLME